MKKNQHSPQALDGFISRRSPVNRRPQINSSQNRNIRSLRTDDILKSENNSTPGTLRFDDDAPIEIQRPDPPKNGKWKKLARRRDQGKTSRLPKRKRVILGCGVLILLLGGIFGFKFLSNFLKLFNGANPFSIFNTTKLRGEDAGRVNILVAGDSADDPGHDGADLTDSIMIVSIDTIHHSAVMLSIPRDLWVDYQTQGCSVGYQGKINAVYECGQETHFNQPGYPKGGMGLLEKVVHDNMGININYYGLINYAAFKDSVNAVGGITINLQTGDPRGIYDPTFDWECQYTCHKVEYSNGNVTLNGEQALDLARARGDFGGYGAGNDFGRTQRQRQMLVSIKSKASSAGTFSNPIAITKLMDTIGNNVQTDFKPAEVHRLYNLGKDINSGDIQSDGLTTDNYLTSYTGADGQSALAPKAGLTDFSDIQAYLKRILSSDPAAQEDAHIAVLNGSDHAGLASTQAQQLTSTFTVDDIGNAGGTYTTSQIYDLSGKKPAALARLEQTYHVTAKNKKDLPPGEQGYDSDFVIILGNDVVSQ